MRKEYIDTIIAGWMFRWPVDEAEGINVNSRFVGEVVQCALYSTWGCIKKMIVYAYLNLQFCLWINNGIWDIYFWVMKSGFLDVWCSEIQVTDLMTEHGLVFASKVIHDTSGFWVHLQLINLTKITMFLYYNKWIRFQANPIKLRFYWLGLIQSGNGWDQSNHCWNLGNFYGFELSCCY